jgi:hypothetical protein
MSSKFQIGIFVVLLVALGLGLTIYKAAYLGFPLTPGEKQKIWAVEATIDFVADGDKPVKVSLSLPDIQDNYAMIDESSASPDYGASMAIIDGTRYAEWARREASGPQKLYYKLKFYYDSKIESDYNIYEKPTEKIKPYEFKGSKKLAAESLIKIVKERSADDVSFTSSLISLFNSDDPFQNVKMLLGERASFQTKIEMVTRILSLEEIPFQIIKGLYLKDGKRKQNLTSLLEVYDGKKWILFDVTTGRIDMPDNFVIWQRGGDSLFEVRGGHSSKIKFSVVENYVPAKQIAVLDRDATLLNFSLYILPSSEQNAFKSLLLIPIGALVVVFMRILVGLKTSGTFMPILIAVAFTQTKLLTGLIMFIVVVAIGLVIRSYLSRLNLLLVARISAVIIVVIGIMSTITILSYKLGLYNILSITFFPMIILSWTIERMSILWEEEGAKEVLLQGSGSLIVAVIAYLAMTNDLIQHITFNFPELYFVVLAIIIALGKYTGYRLFELRRFKSFTEED